MGFPNIIYGDYGDEKATSSFAPGGNPLGQLMILPDGRKFRLAKCGTATALTAGVVVSTSAAVTGHGAIAGSGLLATATAGFNAVGATALHLIAKTVAFTKDEYAGGYANVQLSAGIGHVYKIKGNNSAGSTLVVKFDLEPTDPIKIALASSSTAVSLRKSPYIDAIVRNGGTIIAGPMGVTPVAVSASYYFWAQRSGPASCKGSGTVCVVGLPVFSDTALAGSVTGIVQATGGSISVAEANHYLGAAIGIAMEAPTAAEAVLVDLTIER